MSREITLELLSAVNPAPQPERLTEGLGIDDDALLHLIEQRSATMSTDTEHDYTQGLAGLDDTDQSIRVTSGWRGWKIAMAAFMVVLVAGVGAAIVGLSGSSTPAAPSASFDLVGGEDVNDLDGFFGWAFASEPLASINSPGPTLEVEIGTEVTVTFTNRSGWSNTSPGDAIPQSFRVVPSIPSADTLFDADTGLVEVDGTVTITFLADEVGEFRYVSDGLGMAANGMFGRFVVTEAPEG